MRRGVALSVGLAVLALVAPGCRRTPGLSAAGSDPKRGGILRLAVQTDIQSLDPAIAYDTFSWPLVRLVYQSLLDYDEGTTLVPKLAEQMPAASADGRTYTFRVRKGVRFSNGRELVARDFIYSVERILDSQTQSPGEGFFRNIRGARAFQKAREKDGDLARERGITRERWTNPTRVAGLQELDRYTLRVELEEPDLTFLNIMAMPFASAVPREAVAMYGEQFYCHPVGTGPFILREWRRGARMRFRRNPQYFVPGQPHLDGVDVMVGGDSVVHQMMFERGELDLEWEIPLPDFVRIMGDPKWKPLVDSELVARTSYLALNCELKPFTDIRVRRAMNYAINKERVLQIISGRGVIARGVLPPTMPGYDPHLRTYPYDPARARHLLAEAGYRDGFSVPLWVRADTGQEVRIAEAIQQDLAEVGIKADLKTVAFATLIDAMGRRKNVPLGLFGWSQDYPDPSNFLDVLLRGDRIVEVNCNNAAFYSNPKVDDLLRRAARDTHAKRRLGIYQQVEQMVVDDAPWVFLLHPLHFTLRQPWLRDHRLHPVWSERYEGLWLDRGDPAWSRRP